MIEKERSVMKALYEISKNILYFPLNLTTCPTHFDLIILQATCV
jgi:hypothetical protein